jgi:hypothetical protein
MIVVVVESVVVVVVMVMVTVVVVVVELVVVVDASLMVYVLQTKSVQSPKSSCDHVDFLTLRNSTIDSCLQRCFNASTSKLQRFKASTTTLHRGLRCICISSLRYVCYSFIAPMTIYTTTTCPLHRARDVFASRAPGMFYILFCFH